MSMSHFHLSGGIENIEGAEKGLGQAGFPNFLLFLCFFKVNKFILNNI